MDGKDRQPPGSSRYEVRQAVAADAEAITQVTAVEGDLGRRAYRLTDSALGAAFSEDSVRLVACAEGRVVGTVLYRRKGPIVEIFSLDVMESQRRRGAARAMVAHVEELGRRDGAERLALRAVKELGFVPVLERLGFEAVREEPTLGTSDEPGGPLTDVVMERRLTP